MSAGVFTRARYETNLGVVVPIRVQPETLTAVLGSANNASADEDITIGYPRAVSSRSQRSPGIHARTVTLKFTAAPPTGYAVGQTYRIPVMQEEVWNALGEGIECNYLGVAAEVVSVRAEKIR